VQKQKQVRCLTDSNPQFLICRILNLSPARQSGYQGAAALAGKPSDQCCAWAVPKVLQNKMSAPMEGSWKALTKKHGVFDVQCKAKCSARAGCVLSMVVELLDASCTLICKRRISRNHI